MLKFFKIKKDEMLVLSVEDTVVIKARIYQTNGLEVDYYSKSWRFTKDLDIKPFWQFEWSPDTGII